MQIRNLLACLLTTVGILCGCGTGDASSPAGANGTLFVASAVDESSMAVKVSADASADLTEVQRRRRRGADPEAGASTSAAPATMASTSAAAASTSGATTAAATTAAAANVVTAVAPATPATSTTGTTATKSPFAVTLAVNGDSISNGASPVGNVNESAYVSFRGPLYRALTQAGATVNVIGTRSTPVRDNLGPVLHNAQGGAMLDTAPQVISISALMDELKAAYPNGPYDNWVYVLEGGTNNIYSQTPSEIAAKWQTLIQKQRTLFPGSNLVVIGMMPASWINSSFYAAINPVVAAADTGGKVINALMGNAGLAASDYEADATHLSQAGSVKVGNWLANRIVARVPH